ncbi:MAG: hypothetical protein JWO03_3151 [Bacteroidetes bacterium]|nr:hypothetical protein [Bacteroidota bacterium]
MLIHRIENNTCKKTNLDLIVCKAIPFYDGLSSLLKGWIG